MEFIIDSYAWVEYLKGSEKGEILKRLFLDEKNEFYTIECCLAEIKGWAIKNEKNFDSIFSIVMANSQILHASEQNWIDAGEERAIQREKHKNFGLIDSIILVKQKELNCKIITGDLHFEYLKNIIFLE